MDFRNVGRATKQTVLFLLSACKYRLNQSWLWPVTSLHWFFSDIAEIFQSYFRRLLTRSLTAAAHHFSTSGGPIGGTLGGHGDTSSCSTSSVSSKGSGFKTEVRVAASRAAHTARNFLQACQRFSNNGFNQRKNQQNHLFCSLSSPNIFSISFRDIFCDSLAISRFWR